MGNKKAPSDNSERLTCALRIAYYRFVTEGKGKKKSRNLQGFREKFFTPGQKKLGYIIYNREKKKPPAYHRRLPYYSFRRLYDRKQLFADFVYARHDALSLLRSWFFNPCGIMAQLVLIDARCAAYGSQ